MFVIVPLFHFRSASKHYFIFFRLGFQPTFVSNNYFKGIFFPTLENQHGGLGVTSGQTEIPNTYLKHTPHIDHQQIQSGDIHINPGPTANPCHICHNEVDTQHHLQCDTCDTWLHSDCVNVNQQESSAYETFLISHLCALDVSGIKMI